MLEREHQKVYSKLMEFVDNSCDQYKYEFNMLLYPILVYMYLDLVENDLTEEAEALMSRFGPNQKFYYQDDLKRISAVTKNHQMERDDLVRSFKSNKFSLKMSDSTVSRLKYFLQNSKMFFVSNIINTNLHFDTYKGAIRNESQIDAVLGGMMGTITNPNKNVRVFYGKLSATINTAIIVEMGNGKPSEKPKNKKSDSALDAVTNSITNLESGAVLDPNTPSQNRIPLPLLTDDIQERIDKYKVILGPQVLPWICTHTILYSNNNVSCAKISEDLTMLAIGCLSGRIKVFSLMPQNLRSLKSAKDLQKINLDDDDVEEQIFDNSEEQMRTLIGHSDLVYSICFSKNSKNLLSCSEDETIRLWSLQIWCCMVVYKESMSPVYDVKFSPFGYYFASASGDKLARLWTTKKSTPLRIFAGHFLDVNCIQFHPNSNYVATGSSDRYVCLWDCLSGDQVLLMTGHKSSIRSMEFSVCGRFLASAGNDTQILVWDIKFGNLVTTLRGHKNTITALSFSRYGNVLASGSLDGSLILWDFGSITKDIDLKDEIELPQPSFKTDDSFMLKEYRTRKSPIIYLYFTLRNNLLSVNMHNQSKSYNYF